MELRVYDGELYNRGPWWYVIASTVFGVILVYAGLTNLFFFVIMILMTATYVLYNMMYSKKVGLLITTDGIVVKSVIYPRAELQNFTLEYHPTTRMPHNLILSKGQYMHIIHTIADTPDNTEKFIRVLQQYLPQQATYQQRFIDKLVRICKL